MIFLSSLPRSGSTLLASLLNQRPDVYASPTSNLCNTLGAALQTWEHHPTTKFTSGLDILVFITTDGGTIWHGMVASADSS